MGPRIPVTFRQSSRAFMNRLCLLLIFVTGWTSALVFADERGAYRHPESLAFDADEKRLLTVNSRSGTISVLELASGQVSEHAIGGSPRDLLHLQANRFLTVDFVGHELIEFQLAEDGACRILDRSPVEKYPQRILVTPDRATVFVTSLWSRRLSRLKRSSPETAYRKTGVLDLDFAPREMVLVPNEHRLIVADNHSGKLAVVDIENWRVEFVHATTAHNIRGLGLANQARTILVSHQMLNELAHTSRNDIHWGLLMSNDLRWIETAAFLDRQAELYQQSHMHPLGKENDAAADPGGLAVGPDGTVVVTISGTGEIALGREDDFWLRKIRVGRRPLDVVVDQSGQRAYVANAFDDSISVVDLKAEQVQTTIPLGRRRSLSEVEQGEQLFFDARLSHDGWMSCHSCHTEAHTNGRLNDNFTDGTFGAPKKVISLLGKQGTEPLAWDGLTPDFEVQVRNSIVSTMQSRDPPEKATVDLLVRYLRSLEPPPSLAAARDQLDQPAIRHGKQVFGELGCAECHQPPAFTSADTYDVGLRDEMKRSQFNPPSLLGVSQQSSFFHDGRARSLAEVIFKFRHQIPEQTPRQQLEQLQRFLESL